MKWATRSFPLSKTRRCLRASTARSVSEVDVFLADLKRRGFSGVQNFPTVGLIDEDSGSRQNLEETGMGYDMEVDMIREAASQDMLTCPYVFNETQAREMAEAGATLLSHTWG